MAELLTDDEIERGIAGTEWRRDGGSIVRDRKLDDFAGALAYVNRVGEAAEETNHHPDILIHGWNQVRLTLSTHSEGGLTQSDLDMAQRIDALG